MADFEIIDFHTHPFSKEEYNICNYKSSIPMTAETTREKMTKLGISRFCGSLLGCYQGEFRWEMIHSWNEEALKLEELYQGAYIPGIHVHPSFVRESCDEIEAMSRKGIRLVGELVPYDPFVTWNEEYDGEGFSEILDCIEAHDMVLSIHSMWEESMDRMIERHPKLKVVAAHPGERSAYARHLERMRKDPNYYLDLSGTGLFREGMLRYGIDRFGPERFLFGSDYPTCNPAMFIGGVLLDPLLSDHERELILSGNAKRLLKLS